MTTTVLKLTYSFFLLSLALWIAANYLTGQCEPSQSETNPTIFQEKTPDTPPHKYKEALEWFKGSLPKDLPLLTSSCPPVTRYSNSTQPSLTISAIGEVNLNNTRLVDGLDSLINHALLKKSLLGGSDVVMSSFIGPPKGDLYDIKLTSALRMLSDVGVSLLSLGNQQSLDVGEAGTKSLVHGLEGAGIKWVGLNVRKHEILRLGGMRVGILGYCGLHGLCMEENESPFAPNKYHVKGTKESINELKKHGVDHIIALLSWGKDHSLFPDELSLYIARHLSDFDEISAVVGYHPQEFQGHAYFGNTLVVFSPGNFVLEDNTSCWERDSRKYKVNSEACLNIHPAVRHSLLENESQTIIYRIHLRRLEPATAEYLMIPLKEHDQLRYPSLDEFRNYKWTTVCGSDDSHCLSCNPF